MLVLAKKQHLTTVKNAINTIKISFQQFNVILIVFLQVPFQKTKSTRCKENLTPFVLIISSKNKGEGEYINAGT